MKIIFTKSKSPLSVLIRWGLNEPVSHFAIVFDEFLVFHSNLLGVHMESLPHFLSGTAQIVYEIEYKMNLEEEEAVYKSMIPRYDGESYDFGAFFYFGWRIFLKKFFGVPILGKNPWEKDREFLCTEMVKAIPNSVISQEQKDSMGDVGLISPYEVYLKLKGQNAG